MRAYTPAVVMLVARAAATVAGRCTPQVISKLDVFGAKILSVDAVPVQNHTAGITGLTSIAPAGTWTNLDFCNVTVTYTHPGRDDTITVNQWLPFDWNGRFLGSGGSGWHTGHFSDALAPYTSQGYSVAQTDGGHSVYEESSSGWALNSVGNVNLNLLQDFASLALNDLAVIGKQVASNFYDKAPNYSYWAGCSTGGRQAFMLAQRYPEAFNGILARAPAINWARFLVSMFWAQHVMNKLGYYLPMCEANAITYAAIEACDDLDGVKDGIISLPDKCSFDARSAVGKKFDCNGEEKEITEPAAISANALWDGPQDPAGQYSWYGLRKDANMSYGLLNTTCTNNSASSCTGRPFFISVEWIKLFVLKDPNFDLNNITDLEYFRIAQKSLQEYDGILGTSDPDLSAFKRHGGKLISWDGMSDNLIPTRGSIDLYKRALAIDANVADFYRYFEAPGVAHCQNGTGPIPTGDLAALVEWVERGKAPDTLTAHSQTGDGTVRNICHWPQKQVYVGGDPKLPTSFDCV